MKHLPVLLIAAFLSACTDGTGLSKDPAVRPGVSITKTCIVRTTAYCHLEDGNRRNALSGALASGHYFSASADWSRHPAGTIFRILENGRTYLVDDYGPALVGTETIDLYVPSMHEMRKWGVRNVHISILKPGNVEQSLAILRPRAKRGYIRRMVRDLEHKIH